MDEDQELQNPFPSPPSHYTKFTTHNLHLLSLLKSRLGSTDGSALPPSDAEVVEQQKVLLANEDDVPEWSLLQLEKPRVDWILEGGTYNTFGDTWFIKERIPSLGEMGGTQLYPEDPTVDRRPALQSVLRTLLRTYSSFLASILAPPPPSSSNLPPDWQRLVEWMRVMAQNIIGAANDLRPVQARGNLEAMMNRQLELRREETRAIHEKCDALEAKLEELQERVATLRNSKTEANIAKVNIPLDGPSVSSTSIPPDAEEYGTMDLRPGTNNEKAITLAAVAEEDVLRWAEEAG